MYKIILPIFICFNLSASDIEWPDCMVQHFAEKYDEMLQQNEADYQEYIAENEIQLPKKPKKIAKKYLDLLKKQGKKIRHLEGDLEPVCREHNINLYDVPKSDPFLMALQRINILSAGLDKSVLDSYAIFHACELGIKIEEMKIAKRLSADSLKDFQGVEDLIRPILIEYRVKSFLAKQKEDFIVLGSVKRQKIAEALGYCGDESIQEGDPMFIPVAFNNFDWFLETGVEVMHHDFAYLLEFVDGKPENAFEEACQQVLIKHRQNLSDEWYQKLNELKYCYLKGDNHV